MYTYISPSMYIYTYSYIHIYIHIIYICVYICTYMYMSTCMCRCHKAFLTRSTHSFNVCCELLAPCQCVSHTHSFTFSLFHSHTHTHTCMHVRTHARIHTHTHAHVWQQTHYVAEEPCIIHERDLLIKKICFEEHVHANRVVLVTVACVNIFNRLSNRIQPAAAHPPPCFVQHTTPAPTPQWSHPTHLIDMSI